ncbi:hypothetical protein [Tritonibacter mobilis]|uniref:hypothetical protein n=1 Tax=Tritonibacter mobilis TaxID=379347 RepID=UPI000AF40069|nr:hypothetical protein [Tritonibacter mobilis]
MDGATQNVVTEDGLRNLLSDGYLIEVICNQTAEKRHNSWYGSWVVHAVTKDGKDAKMLVTSRSVFKLRKFKTIVGLVSFLADMGCLSANIPLIAGRRERHEALGSPATATSLKHSSTHSAV